MKLGAGALIIAVGLLVLWLAVTGKLGNIEAAWRALVIPQDLKADLEKASKATATLPPLALPDSSGRQGATFFNVPLPFPGLPALN